LLVVFLLLELIDKIKIKANRGATNQKEYTKSLVLQRKEYNSLRMKRGAESIEPPLPIIELVDKQSGGSKFLLTENLPTTGEDSPKALMTCRGDSPKHRIMASL